MVAQAIKAQLGDVHITWVVRDIFAGIVQASKAVDEVIIFKRTGGLNSFGQLIAQIRSQSYDAVLDMQGLFRSGLMAFFAKAPLKIGRKDAREGAGIFYNKKVSLPPKGKSSHAVEILMEFLPALGLEKTLPNGHQFEVDPQSFSAPWGNLPVILLFPNSRRPEKEWGGFTMLTDFIIEEMPTYAVAWAGQTPIAENPDWPTNRFFNLIGKTSLEDMLTCISQAKLVVSNDSGPMHLAAAMDKQLICLFGPTEPHLYGPYPLDKPTHHILRPQDGQLALLRVGQVMQQINLLIKR